MFELQNNTDRQISDMTVDELNDSYIHHYISLRNHLCTMASFRLISPIMILDSVVHILSSVWMATS